MQRLLENKCGLVTGAGRGIGRVIAERMAEEGARVLVVDINADGAEEAAAQIRAAGGVAQSMACDVSDEPSVIRMVQTVRELWGGIDIACNNAGQTGNERPLHEFEQAHYDAIVRHCMTNTMLCMKHEIGAMLECGGAIVNISSNASLRGLVNNAPYAAAKSGVNTLTRSAAAECGRLGVRINAVSPGPIRTPAMDKLFEDNPKMANALARTSVMGRMGEPREVAEAVVFLLSDRASFITGQILSVDGGAAVR